jgi:hypothetical protein
MKVILTAVHEFRFMLKTAPDDAVGLIYRSLYQLVFEASRSIAKHILSCTLCENKAVD